MKTKIVSQLEQVFLYQWVFAGLGIFAIDQATKYLASSSGNKVFLNSGISFGAGDTVSPEIVLALTVFVAIGIFIVGKDLWRKNPLVSGIFWGAVLSNIFDRIFFGGVRDWLPIPILSVHNNLADIAIISSLSILLFRKS
ncbi:MAG: signal peptidase II [Microgenomates group bacterium]